MAPRAIVRAARKVSRLLVDQNIPHALVGGLAVGLYGYNRTTRNVDFLVFRSAQKGLEELGPRTPISEPLKGVSTTMDRVDMNFIFVAKPLRRRDISSAIRIASVPVIGLDPLIVMKMVAGRTKDLVDIADLLRLGEVSVEKVSERLSGEDLDRFKALVTIAKLEKKGQARKARRLLVAMLGNSVGLDIVGAG